MELSAEERLAMALHHLGSQQAVVEDTHGNVSSRGLHELAGHILIKPSGMPYSDVTWRDVCVISADGQQRYPLARRPSVDTAEHLKVYGNNPHVMSVCHTHSPYATAAAISGHDLEVLCTEHADYFGMPVRCLPYASLDAWGDLELLPGERAVLLGRHGTLTLSDDPDPISAVKLAVALEMIAKKYRLADHVGAAPLDPTEVSRWHTRFRNVYGQR
jgi:L-ribulose-5-phosphate 4-epimerase